MAIAQKGGTPIKSILICALLSVALYLILTSRFPGVYTPALKSINRRGVKKLTQTQIAVGRLADTLQPHITLEPIRRFEMDEMLKTLGYTQSPEAYTASAVAKGVIIALMLIWVPVLSLPIGVAAMILVGVVVYKREIRKLKQALEQHRSAIEKELPQFASTIRQTLNSTFDIVSILANYRKICGPVLAGEIDKTLNDIMTGNAQKALNSLEGRVSSAKLSQLTRGLQAVLRGDDQRAYFDVLAADYRRAQDEEVERTLLKRPKELHPLLAVLFICLALMIIASVGADVAYQINNFF